MARRKSRQIMPKKVKRKTISKKLRFEIFKRDGFSCAYCGQTPPLVTLEIDHIEPVSKGGLNDINNYVTACFDCNRGKSNISLNKIPSKLSENLKALKEKENQIIEYQKFIKSILKRENREIKKIAKIYSDAFPEYKLSESFKNSSLKKFLKKLPKHEIEEAMYDATSLIGDDNGAIKYFCGICWNKIKEK